MKSRLLIFFAHCWPRPPSPNYLPGPGAATAVLRFSYVGYLPVERPVGNAPTLDVLLRADTRQLSEVVVTASGAGPRRAVVGAAPCGGRRGGGSLCPIQLKI